MNVARNVLIDPCLVPGGGAAEMAVAQVTLNIVVADSLDTIQCYISKYFVGIVNRFSFVVSRKGNISHTVFIRTVIYV